MSKANGRFRLPDTGDTILMEFDGDMTGAWARVKKDVSVGTFVELAELVEGDQKLHVFKYFGDKILQEWNLDTADGVELPATGDGMQRLTPSIALIIINAYVGTVTNIDSPLEPVLNAGST